MASILEQIEYEESTVKNWKSEWKETGKDAAHASLTKHRLLETAERLEDVSKDLRGTKGRYNKMLADSVVDGDWITIAYIGISQVFKVVEDTGNSLQTVIYAIGGGVEDHYKMTLFEKTHKKTYDTIKEKLKKRGSKDVDHGRRTLNFYMRQTETTWERWDIAVKSQIGARILRVVLEVYEDIFSVETYQEGTKRKTRVRVTPEFKDWETAFIEYRSSWCVPPLPLKIPGTDWGTDLEGGFYTERMKVKKVKCRNKTHESKIKNMPEVDEALNRQQKVAWVINKKMLSRVQEVLNSGAYKDIPDLSAQEHTEIAEYLKCRKEERTEEQAQELRNWKYAERDAYESEVKVAARMMKVSRTVKTALMLEKWEEFYFVYNCDLVGRMYCNSVGINTQGGDLEKSLLDFKKKYKVSKDGRKWLRITTAKYFGIKGSEKELLKWFADNEELIQAVRDDWSVNWWTKADKPWLFLRMCTEAYEEYSSMPIPLDGVCNGLQHYAALMRCKTTAENLGMTTKYPSDVYTLVKDHLEILYGKQEWLTRSFTKTPVMLIAYGISKNSMKRLLWPKLQKYMTWEEGNKVGENLWEALQGVIKAAIAGMEILKKEYTDGFMEWITPTGFVCYQPYEKTETIVIKLTLSETVRINMKKETGECNKRKQKSAYPANKIHSMDASHAVRIVNNTNTDIRCTHDEFAVNCNKVSILQETIANEFIKLYKEVKLADGDLLLSSIQNSKYFFC